MFGTLLYTRRLSTVVWDVAFVVQGNSIDELPEQVRSRKAGREN